MSIPANEIEAVTTYWHNGKAAVVRQWRSRKAAQSYCRMMKREKKKVTIQEWHSA